MEKLMFITEAKQELNRKHEISLRNLYLPIIGMEAITVYSLLSDYNYMNKSNPTYNSLRDIATVARMSISDVMIAKNKLEAVGLIRTFEKADNMHFVFILNAPLLPESFKKNQTLFKEAIKQVGEVIFERVYFTTKPDSIAKDDFKEVTVKYHDVFEITHEVSTTLEIPMAKFGNIDEAVKGLTSPQFVKYISKEKVTPTQLHLIQRLNNSGLSSHSINEIINYSYEINGKVVSNHIETIANDLISKGITNPQDIHVEMKNAKKSNKPTTSHIVFENTSPKVNSDLSWSDIFESLGGEV